MFKRFLLAASLLIFFTPAIVSACTCAFPFGSCIQAWRSGEVIFTGTVTTKLSVTTPGENDFSQNGFQFSVSESFGGSAIAKQNMIVYTGTGGGDCGFPFEVGTSYLVYAYLSKGKLITHICSPTSQASRVPHIIRQLRALKKGERVPDLFGVVGTSPISFAEDPMDMKPLAGKQVRAISSHNLEHSAITDSEGVFSFQLLPADTYRIEIDLPPGMSSWQRNKGEAYTVEVGAKGVFGCPASFSFGADGRIEGKVVDENGNGLVGFVTSEPVDPKEAELARRRGGTMGSTTESGEFELWLLRPSRYRLIFRPTINGQVNFQVPPVKSEVITVGLGQHIRDFRFKVPSARP